MLQNYTPTVVALCFGIGFSCLFLGLAMFLGPKRPSKEKLAPFECGSEPIGTPRVRFSVKFYQVAILFLVFDIEAAFLYPWATVFKTLSWFGLVEMLVFISTLVVALTYVWRKRAIGWG